MAKRNAPKFTTYNKIEKNVLFEYYAPLAESVSVTGDFNKWDESACLMKQGQDGRWSLTLKLAPGRYEYRYLVDGEWQNDQRPVKCVPNAYGTWNCVVEVL